MSREARFLARVRQALLDLGPAERKLGELVSSFPGELASYNASELAALAGVSNATVTRFVRRLGYQSYEEARVDAREERASGSRLYAGRVAGAMQSPEFFAERDGRNIQLTLGALDEESVARLVARILSARKIWTIGYRASAPFAAYLQWQLTQVMENIAVIPGPGQTMGEHLASLVPQDLAIFFALRRRVAPTDMLIDRIREAGAALVLVTDEGLAPDARADWHIRCETSSPGSLFSHAAVMSVCGLIASRTISAAGSAGQERLTGIERLNDSLDEL